MKMTLIKIRQLIDIAIGFPEPGHVNFSALNYLLFCIAKKLEITDDLVEFHNIEAEAVPCCKKTSSYELVKRSRLTGGNNPSNEISPEPEVVEDSDNDDVNIEQGQAADPVEQPDIRPVEAAVEPPSETPIVVVDGSSRSSLSSQTSIQRLRERINEIETKMQNISIPKALLTGISVMKDHLDFVIDQMLLLTFLTLSKKPNPNHIKQLYSMVETLLGLRKENTYIENFRQVQLYSLPPLDWQSSDLQLNGELLESDILEARDSESTHSATGLQQIDRDELDDHPSYSPSKLLDQLMELKGEFVSLTNKVNELSSLLLQQDSQNTVALIENIQDQIRDIQLTAASLKETQSRVELRLTNNQSNIDNMKGSIQQLFEEKVDKNSFDIQLANKVDYNQLQRKVSLDQVLELQCRLDKRFCELLRRINENEKKFTDTVENIRTTSGFSDIDEELKKFKANINKDIQDLNELLKNYTASAGCDSAAAAGSRVKVLQDLACLSCDATCVMRTKEKATVAKLPSAHASNIISPLVTYELGSIRKSGLMGYYRKDEFPHAPNAWLAQQSNTLTSLKNCVQRHAGGPHTTNTARERFKKVSNIK